MVDRQKKIKFLATVAPYIDYFASQWFQPSESTGVCGECSCNCGRMDKHDADCDYQNAKTLKEKWAEIDASHEWDHQWWGDKLARSEDEVYWAKTLTKFHAFFEIFLVGATSFMPMDYSDPHNEGKLCYCNLRDIFTLPENDADKIGIKHYPNCPIVGIGAALADLYKS